MKECKQEGNLRACCQVSQTQTELGNDWYLERVEVTGPEGVCWVFACEDWFGRTEDDESVGAPCPFARCSALPLHAGWRTRSAALPEPCKSDSVAGQHKGAIHSLGLLSTCLC